jgi:hypothetical protein
MVIKKYIQLFLILSFFKIINPHGFGANTVIQNKAGGYWSIVNMVDYVGAGNSLQVFSYDEFEQNFIPKKVKSAGFCESEYHCRLFFNHDKASLECTPLQLFYRVKDHVWVAAFKLKAGDKLLCAGNKMIEILDIELRHENLKVYTLEIKGTHTFLVTPHNIVAHNMLLPCGAIAGLAIPLDIGCGASVGSVFGPIGICAGVVVSGIVGYIVNACIKDRVIEYGISFKPEKTSKPQQIDNLYHFAKSVEDILKNTVPGNKTKGQARQYIKNGGYPAAVKDFEDLGPTNIRKIPGKEGIMGTLPDGREVNVRVESTDERPTLEIMMPGGDGKRIKIRYEESKS